MADIYLTFFAPTKSYVKKFAATPAKLTFFIVYFFAASLPRVWRQAGPEHHQKVVPEPDGGDEEANIGENKLMGREWRRRGKVKFFVHTCKETKAFIGILRRKELFLSWK